MALTETNHLRGKHESIVMKEKKEFSLEDIHGVCKFAMIQELEGGHQDVSCRKIKCATAFKILTFGTKSQFPSSA